MTKPPFERVLDRLREAYPDGLSEDECWPWPGSSESLDYGRITYDGVRDLVHRVVYRAVHGEIPEGHHVDHTCHNADLSCPGGKQCRHRSCCNWNHLVAKTPAQNSDSANEPRKRGKYKIECKQGHPFTEENSFWVDRVIKGRSYRLRHCKACNRERAYKRVNGSERPVAWNESLSRAGTPDCSRGHAYDELNTKYDTTTGKRRCRKCERLNNTNAKRRKKGLEPLAELPGDLVS